MKPLSREASDALSALKSPEPSAADEARVRKNLERTLGLAIPVAGVAMGASAASAQAATGAGASGAAGGATALSLGAKVAGFVFAVGVGTTLTVAATRSVMAPRAAPGAASSVVSSKPTVVPTPVAAPEPVAAVESPEVEVTVEEPPAVVAEAAQPVVVQELKPAVRARPVVAQPVLEQPVVAAAVAPPAAAPAVESSEPAEPELLAPPAPPNTQESYDLQIETQFPNCDAATEMRSALNARKLLLVSRAEEAVGLLEAYQRRCPSGRWSDEAWTVRLGGLCMLGRNAEARGFLEWFSTESPERRAAVVADLHTWCSEALLKEAE